MSDTYADEEVAEQLVIKHIFDAVCGHGVKPDPVNIDDAINDITDALERVRREERERCFQLAKDRHQNTPGSTVAHMATFNAGVRFACREIMSEIHPTPESEGE